MIEVARPLAFVWDDGGREEAGYRGKTGDCVVRACAILTGLPYKQVYTLFKKSNPNGARIDNYGSGVGFNKTDEFLEQYGFFYHPTIYPLGEAGQLVNRSLPEGKLIVQIRKHAFAVIDHTIHDTFDCARGGVYRVYTQGYWQRNGS